MKLMDRLTARRRRKAHERYLEEREWQRLLAKRDTEETIRDAAMIWGVAGQATSSPGSGLTWRWTPVTCTSSIPKTA